MTHKFSKPRPRPRPSGCQGPAGDGKEERGGEEGEEPAARVEVCVDCLSKHS